jgi:hypothetical protein
MPLYLVLVGDVVPIYGSWWRCCHYICFLMEMLSLYFVLGEDVVTIFSSWWRCCH